MRGHAEGKRALLHRGGRRAPSPHAGSAGQRQEHARPAAHHAAAPVVDPGTCSAWRASPPSPGRHLRRSSAPERAVPQSAPHGHRGGAGWAAGPARSRARYRSPISACCSWTSCRNSLAARWRRCARPLENGTVSIARSNHRVSYPCEFQLIAAMNPCPCGYLGDGTGRCRCTEARLDRYRSRLSGPILDRFDIQVGSAPHSLRRTDSTPRRGREPGPCPRGLRRAPTATGTRRRAEREADKPATVANRGAQPTGAAGC